MNPEFLNRDQSSNLDPNKRRSTIRNRSKEGYEAVNKIIKVNYQLIIISLNFRYSEKAKKIGKNVQICFKKSGGFFSNFVSP